MRKLGWIAGLVLLLSLHGHAASYPHRYVVIVSLTHLTAANNAARQWDPDAGGGKTFSTVRLSATGLEPATHTACETSATEGMKGLIMAAANVPWIEVFDRQQFTFDAAVRQAGLVVIRSRP